MKHETKTLIILSPGFPKDEDDTSCLPSQQIFVRALNKNFPSLKIVIISFRYPFSTTTYNWYGNLVIPFNGTKNGVMAKSVLWLRVWRKLQRLKKDNPVIGLFSFWCGECALIGKYFGKRNKLKHFSWITGQDARKGNKFIPVLRPGPHELVAMSDFLSKEFQKNYGVQPAHVIPNGVGPSLFAEHGTERDITILGAGSLIPLKQYGMFIAAVKEISKEVPEVKAMLCGEGEQEMALERLITQHRLQDIIVLAGHKSHAGVLQMMQRAKVFLHTSNYEGFSTVCLEALSAGCHVISFIKPMQHDMEHWHIVESQSEMVIKAIELLKDRATLYTPRIPYVMDNSARAVMHLFNYREEATC